MIRQFCFSLFLRHLWLLGRDGNLDLKAAWNVVSGDPKTMGSKKQLYRPTVFKAYFSTKLFIMISWTNLRVLEQKSYLRL